MAAQTVKKASLLQSMLSVDGVLDTASLCIVSGGPVWIVHIDAVVIEDGGNLADVLSLAVRGALATTRIPRVTGTRRGGRGVAMQRGRCSEAAGRARNGGDSWRPWRSRCPAT